MTKRAVMIGAGAFCAVGVVLGVLFGLYADAHDLDTWGGSAAVVIVVMAAANILIRRRKS